MAEDTPIAADEPMFAGLKKKKTKKAVNFDEDLTLADDVAASKTMTNEDAVEAVQELVAASAPESTATNKSCSDALGNDAPVEAADDTDMFADLKKKKKKKKDIPMDLVGSFTSGSTRRTLGSTHGSDTADVFATRFFPSPPSSSARRTPLHRPMQHLQMTAPRLQSWASFQI